MARHGTNFQKSGSGWPATSLDWEASLRRQFVVPPPVANPGASFAPADGTGSGWTFNFRLSFPRSVSLRQAAGLLLAATLWGSAGLLVWKHAGAAGPRYASAAVPGVAIESDSALVRLAVEYMRPGLQPDRASDPETAMALQNELWNRLETMLQERYGSALDVRLDAARESDRGIELLAVNDSFASDGSLVFVAARIDGRLSTALFESSSERTSRLPIPGQKSGSGIEAPPSSTELPHLFRGRVTGGFAYEITAAESPPLMNLLFEDAPARVVMTVRPERYRSPQKALSITP
jgi:hypothetical protein